MPLIDLYSIKHMTTLESGDSVDSAELLSDAIRGHRFLF